MDSPLDSVYLIFPKYVRMRDSFAFILPSVGRINRCSDQCLHWSQQRSTGQLHLDGFESLIPAIKKCRYPNGYLHFLCLLNTIDAILDFYNLLCTSVHIHSDASGCTWILPRTKQVSTGHLFTPVCALVPSFRILSHPLPIKKPHQKVWFFYWQRMRDSNPRKRSQSPVCYRYTNPLCAEHIYYTQIL